MKQLQLFPPPGIRIQPLPEDQRTLARRLLADLLVAAVETAAPPPTGRPGESHEQDPKNPS